MSKCVITGVALVHPHDEWTYTHGDLYDCGSFWVVVFNPNWQRGEPAADSKLVLPIKGEDSFLREVAGEYGTFACEKSAMTLSPAAQVYIKDGEDRVLQILQRLKG